MDPFQILSDPRVKALPYDQQRAVFDRLIGADERVATLDDDGRKATLDKLWRDTLDAQPKEGMLTGLLRGADESFRKLEPLGLGAVAGIAAASEAALGEGGLSTGVKKWAVGGMQEANEGIARNAQPSDSFSYSLDAAKEGDLGSLARWVSHGLGNVGGQAAQLLMGAGVGKVAAQAILTKAAPKVIAKMAEKEAMKLAQAAVAKKGLQAGEAEIIKLASHPEIIKQATRNIAGSIGEHAFMAGAAFGMEGGEIGGGLAEQSVNEGRTLTGGEVGKMFLGTFGAGLVEYAEDFLTLGAMRGKLPTFQGAKEMTGLGGRLARGGIGAATVAPVEAGQEVLQTGIERWAQGKELTGPEAEREYWDSGAMGGLFGGVGLAGGMMTKPQAPQSGPPPASSKTTAEELLTTREQGRADRVAKEQAKLDAELAAITPAPISPISPQGAAEAEYQGYQPETPTPDQLYDLYTPEVPQRPGAADEETIAPLTGLLVKPFKTEQQALARMRTAIKSGELEGDHSVAPVEDGTWRIAPNKTPDAAKTKGPLTTIAEKAIRQQQAATEEAAYQNYQPEFPGATPEATPEGMVDPTTGEIITQAHEVAGKAHEAATSPLNDLPQPTPAQKDAGNYRKGHASVHGLDVSIENPAGSERSGTDKSGKAWSIPMQDHYGYLRGTTGKDKDHLDVFINPARPESDKVFVVDQVVPETGKFDEHKLLFGFDTEEEARAGYLRNYNSGWQGLGTITGMPVDQFKVWAKSGKTKQPMAVSNPPDASAIASVSAPSGEVLKPAAKVNKAAILEAKAKAKKAANAPPDLPTQDSKPADKQTPGFAKETPNAQTDKVDTVAAVPETGKTVPVLAGRKEGVEGGVPAEAAGGVPIGRGARKITALQQAKVDEARELFQAAANNPDLVGKQRADTIANLRNLTQFWEANTPDKVETGYERGDQVAYTGETTDTGLRKYVYLEGSKAGAEGVSSTTEQRTANADRNQREWQNQQAEFAKLQVKKTPETFTGDTGNVKKTAENDNMDRPGMIARRKELLGMIRPLATKGDLTAREGAQYNALTKEMHELSFDLTRAISGDKIGTEAERQSTLSPDVVLAAHGDLMRDRNIYRPIVSAAAGVAINADTAVDDVMNGKNPTVTPRALYDAFAGAREAMRKQYGDTVKLYRATGKQKDKATTNWATTEEYARQFGDKIVSRDVPVDDVIAVNVGTNGKYHEIIVGTPPVKQPSSKEEKQKQEDAATVSPTVGSQSSKPASEMTAAELLRAAADKMDAVDKPATDKVEAPVESRSQAEREDATAKTDLDFHNDTMARIHNGEATLAEYKAGFQRVIGSKEELTAELSGMTKDRLLDRIGGFQNKSDKKDFLVRMAYDDMFTDFWIEPGMFSYGMDGPLPAMKKAVNSATEATLAAHAEKVKASRAERKAQAAQMVEAVKDPKTLEDFHTFIRAKRAEGKTFAEARMAMTQEQQATFDELTALKSRKERGARKEEGRTQVRTAGSTAGAEIIATKHTRDGYDLFVVQAEERVEREIYNEWNAVAKKMGGWYSKFRGNGAVPGFQFKTREAAEAFQKYVSKGDTEAVKEQAQARRDAYADDRSQTAVERLTEMADKLEERADASLNQDRKANTSRRAAQAASAESAATSDKALAKTMRNIAGAIKSGAAQFLDRVRQKSQVEMLRAFTNRALYAEQREKYPEYRDYEQHKGESPTASAASFVEFPQYTAYRSDLARLGRELEGIEGTKKIGAAVLKVANDISDAYLTFAKENLHKVSTFSKKDGSAAVFKTRAEAEGSIQVSGHKGNAIVVAFKRGQNMIIMSPSLARERGVWEGDDDKRITITNDAGAEIVAKVKAMGRRVSMPYIFENVRDEQARLAGMGIETPAELRAAVREFIALREAPKAPDKVKELERAMVGRVKDGLDFFPTPEGVAQDMIEAAGIEEGMIVLEPSAGMGHIAEKIREAGVDPDVVEMSGKRRELLEAKGFNVVGQDFMDTTEQYDRIIMNPPFSDRRDAEHVQHAYSLLKPGGRLVAIMGEGVFFGHDKKAQAFREWLDSVNGTAEKLEEGTFLDPSLPVNTGANARMVVVDKETDKGERLYSRANKTEWPDDFPNATTHTTMVKLKAHPDYGAAKAGDVEAAIRLVGDLVSPAKIKEIKARHPNAIVVAPHAIEAAGKNAIPRVLAEAFGDAGFAVNTDIVQTNEPHRTKKDSALRLVLRPEFAGDVEAGQEYILLDDAIGQGGTVAELRFFIESNGGRVVDVSALTSGIFGNKLSIRSETIQNLEEKFSREKLEKFLDEFNTAGRIEALTEKEGRYILRQPSLDSLRNQILADAREAGISPSAWQVQASLSRLASRSTTAGQTPADTRAELSEKLGQRDIDRLEASGKLNIVRTMAGLPEKIRAGLAKYMVAWHGSPHRFNKFSTDNIGSGEGAQVYGHGLYFASNKEVAEWYKGVLSEKYLLVNGVKYKGQLSFKPAVDFLKTKGMTKEEALFLFHNDPHYTNKALLEALKDKVGAERFKEIQPIISEDISFEKEQGALYQVELAPAEDEYLLWGKPLSEQSEKVKAAVAQTFDLELLPKQNPVGREIYKYLSQDTSEIDASADLHAMGIRGIKYLDGTSRTRPLREIKAEFLAELPEDATIEEIEELTGTGKFSAKTDALLESLAADDWLGFSYPAQAISAALGKELANYEASPALLSAVAAAKDGGTYNYVIFNDEDVSITALYSTDGKTIVGAYVPYGFFLENTPPNEGNLDITARDIQSFSDLVKANSFGVEGFGSLDVPRQRMMIKIMRTLIHEPEIINAVVKFVPVDMVDALISGELSVNVFLHDMNMLSLLPAAKGNKPVALSVNTRESPLGVVAAALGTEVHRSVDSTGDSQENGFARIANNLNAAILDSGPALISRVRHPGSSSPGARETAIPGAVGAAIKSSSIDGKSDSARITGDLNAQVPARLRAEILRRSLDAVLFEVEQLAAIKAGDIVHGSESPVGKSFGTRQTLTGSEGYVKPGSVWLVSDAIEKGQAFSVLAHEAGHALLDSDPIYQKAKPKFIADFKRLEKFGSTKAKAARAMVPEDTGLRKGEVYKELTGDRKAEVDAIRDEEAMAYLVQQEANKDMPLYKRIIAAIKMALMRWGMPVGRLTESDLVNMFVAGAHKWAKGGVAEKSFSGALSPVLYSKEQAIEAAKAFYSRLQNAASEIPETLKASRVIQFLKTKLKDTNEQRPYQEIQAIGLDAWLQGKHPNDDVSRQEIMDFVKANAVELEDVVLKDRTGETVTDDELIDAMREQFGTVEINGDSLNVHSDENAEDNDTGWDSFSRDEAVSRFMGKFEDTTHFSQYTEPGAVEGSYREMFVTAPGVVLDVEIPRIETIKANMGMDRNLWFIYNQHGENITGDGALTKEKAIEKAEKHIERFKSVLLPQKKTWQDGHSQYKNISNPVVRIRFNTVMADGKRILRIEEIQGPNPDNQEKMPAYLRENIYQLGIKRALAYAKENGFDGVALATKPGMSPGQTQKDRYSLSKQFNSITWLTGSKASAFHITGETLDGNTHSFGQNIPANRLESYIGKELAKRILTENGQGEKTGQIVGEELDVGGAGLIRLYDTTIPAMLEAYGKGKMESANVEQEDNGRADRMAKEVYGVPFAELTVEQKSKIEKGAADVLTAMPYLPLENAPASYPMFSVKQADGKDSPKKAAISGTSTLTEADIADLVGSITKRPKPNQDTTVWERLLSTPEYYFRKIEALARVVTAALNRKDLRFTREQEILGAARIEKVMTDDGAAWEVDVHIGGEAAEFRFLSKDEAEEFARSNDFTRYAGWLRDNNKDAYVEANDYLVDLDRSGDGFSVKENRDEDGWVVLQNGKVVSKHDGSNVKLTAQEAATGKTEAEKEAVAAMIRAEGEYLQKLGFDLEAIEAVSLARELTNRGFDVMSADMRRVIKEAKDAGLPNPLVGDGEKDESGRWAIYADGKKMPLAMFATEEEAAKSLFRAREMISYHVTLQDGKTERGFASELKAREWAAKHGGRVKGRLRFGSLSVRMRTDAELRPMTVQQALAQMGDLRGSYFPRQRRKGDYVLIAKKDGENPVREHFDIPLVTDKHPTIQMLLGGGPKWASLPMTRRARELKAQGYHVEMDYDTSPTEDIFSGANVAMFVDSILKDAMQVVNKNDPADVKAGQQINKLLTMQVADLFKARGYLSSRMKRLEDTWEGYETDMTKALVQYGKGIAAGVAKRETAKAMIDAFTGRDYTWKQYKDEVEGGTWEEYQTIVEGRAVNPRTQKNAYSDGRKFIVDMLRNDEKADRIIGTMKGLAVVKFLGFRVSSAAVNATNMVTGVPATIAGHFNISLNRAGRYIWQAVHAYTRYRTGKTMNVEDRAIFHHISDMGWDDPLFNHEAAKELRGKLDNNWNKFTTFAMFMFGAVEKANRATTLFAAYKAAKEQSPGASDSVLWEKAKQVSDNAHGVYGKETRPGWTRGDTLPTMLSMPYTFMKFGHNYMLNAIDLGFNKKQWKAMSYLLLSPAILGGAGASVPTALLMALAQALGLGGDDPEEDFYAWAEKEFGAGRFARHGITGLAGINIKGSLQVNFPTHMKDLAGAPVAVVTDVITGISHLAKGEIAKGVEKILPAGLGNPIRAARESIEGVTTGSYGTVFYGNEPLKPDGVDTALRFFSFNPSGTSAIREMQRNEKEVEAAYSERKKAIYAKIKRLDLQGKAITPEVAKEIARFNERATAGGAAEPITPQSIKRVLKGARSPSKKERERGAA